MKKNKTNEKKAALWVLAVILALAAIMVAVFALLMGEAAPVEHPKTTLSTAAPVKTFDPIDLGDGLKLTGLAAATGNFPEDGSDAFVENMLSATFVNEGEKTLQYAKIHVTVDGQVYTFEFSTLPQGKQVRAFDMGMQTAPESVEEMSAAAEYLVFFPEEPSTCADQLEVTMHDGYLTVKNISGQDIAGEISIFYKNVTGGIYMGGITYRVRINGLRAGETVNGYSSHASGTQSELMFVTYAS